MLTSMNNSPLNTQSGLTETPAPPHRKIENFEVRPADRLLRLPPYMFGRINHMLYEKRVAGHDVIDLGMGNPSDPPPDFVIQ
jgi:alanine-synthesizing transaminase